MKKLNVVALQHNQLTGPIPRTLGELAVLERLDLSFNQLNGSISVAITKVTQLDFFDVHNNTLSGFVPNGNLIVVYTRFFQFLGFFLFRFLFIIKLFLFVGLKRLNNGFSYKNNGDLCCASFSSLRPCTGLDMSVINDLEPFTPLRNTTLP